MVAYIRKDQRKKIVVGQALVSYEYPLPDKDINIAVVSLRGRYPEQGFVVNSVCTELVYIVAGQGTVVVGGEPLGVSEGDVVLIKPGQQYFWQGTVTMLISATPAWYSEQHKKIEGMEDEV